MTSRAPKVITSLTNDRVKAIRALEMRKARKETGLFVAEGAALIRSARDNGFMPETIVYRGGAADSPVARALIEEALSAGKEVLEVSEAVLAKLASKDNPQTMLGVFRQRYADQPRADRVAAGETWLALEAIRDPGNLGTIVRTADAAGCAGVILVGTTCDPFSLEAIRATMGSIFAVPIARLDTAAFAELACAWPGDVVATEIGARQDFRGLAYRQPELILMGSEGPGLSERLAGLATKRVKIPMAGRLDSLNLAVATALMLYEVRRTRLKL